MTDSPTPKRRNAVKTKAEILAAAQQAFAGEGYSQTGMRDIAALAGVSSPMLHRYFGTKASLFEAALIETIRVEGLFGVNREHFGELLTTIFLDASAELHGPSIVALATSHRDGRNIATAATKTYVIEPLAAWLGPPDAEARAFQIVMLGMGFVLCSRQLPLLPTDDGSADTVSSWFARTVQAIVDQPRR